MTDRAFRLSHPRYHQKNFELLVNTLLNNGYPLSLIFDTINTRLKFLLRQHKFIPKKGKSEGLNISDCTPWFTVPYLPKFATKFKEVIRDLNARLSFYSLNKLGESLKHIKTSSQNYRIKMLSTNYVAKIAMPRMWGKPRDKLKQGSQNSAITSTGTPPHNP